VGGGGVKKQKTIWHCGENGGNGHDTKFLRQISRSKLMWLKRKYNKNGVTKLTLHR